MTARVAGRPPTLAHMFWDRAQTSPDAVAFSYPVNGVWQESTWAQTRALVEPLTAGLIGLGIEPEDRVAIISETRFEWILADLAIMCAGGAMTTLHPWTRAEEVAHILDDSDVTVVFVESLEQVAKLRQIRADIRKVRKVVLFDLDHPDARVMTLEQLLVSGEAVLAADPSAVVTRLAALRPDMLATINYPLAKIGKTGVTRGVRHSQAAWTSQGEAIAAEEILGPDDLQLLWLPLSHSSGRLMLTAQLACGFATAVDGDVERIFDNLARTQPTFMAAAPGFFAAAHAQMLATQDRQGGAEGGVSDQTCARVRESFGARLRLFISGGALDLATVEFFMRAGIPILEVYGWAAAETDKSINRPPDGWLSTGGIGEFDEVGQLRISGRKADRVKAARGN